MSEHKVYCPVRKQYFKMKGNIVLLANGLQTLQVKSCSNEPHCTMMSHRDCVVGKDLQGGKW